MQRAQAELLGVFVVAVACRLLYLFDATADPSWGIPLVDAGVYDEWARFLAFGGTAPDGPLTWQPVGYPVLLSGLYRLGLTAGLGVPIVQAVVGGGTAVLTAWTAGHLFGDAARRMAGAIVALYAPLWFFEAQLLATGWAALWAATLIAVAAHAGRSPTLWHYGAFGLVGGVAVLTRTTFLPFVVLGGAWLVVQAPPRSWPLLIGLALPLGPAVQYASVFPSSSGLNAWIGNNPEACDTQNLRPGLAWNALTTSRDRPGAIGQWDRNQAFMRDVQVYAVSDPVGLVRGLGAKSLHLVSSREIPRNLDPYVHSRWSGVLGLGLWKLGPFGFPFGVLLPLAVVGGVLQRDKVPPVLWLFLGTYGLALVAVFVTGRYRAPMVPALAVLASGVVAMPAAWPSRAATQAAVAGALALVVAVAPGPFCVERPNLDAEVYFLVARYHEEAGRTALAEKNYRASLDRRPDYFEALHRQGLFFIEQGRLPEAETALRHAAELEPEDVKVRVGLGSALGRQNKLEEARAVLERALELDPTDAEAHANLGTTKAMGGDLPGAVEHFRTALSLDPQNQAARANLMRAEAQMGR